MSTVTLPTGSSERERVEALAAQTLRFVLAAIAYRALVTVPTVTNNIGVVGSAAHAYILASAVIVAADLALLVGVASGRFRWLLWSNAFFGADLLVTVGLSLWAASILPRAVLLLPGWDAFTFYAAGTVVLWTALRGARTGGALVAGGALLLGVTALLNGSVFDFAGWMQYLARLAWLVAVFAVALVMMTLARKGDRLAVVEGERAGREAARADALRALHDTVLQTLARIAQKAAGSEQPARERLREIRQIALEEERKLRAALDQANVHARSGLAGGLEALATEFQGRGLRVELVTAEFNADPSTPVTQALVGAAREALTNVTKHADVTRAVVRAASSAKGIEVEVHDHGRGFDLNAATNGFGLTNSIRQRMAAVGGSAQVWSAPDRGTRVRLTVPARQGGFLGLDSAEAMTRALSWFALAPLTFRTVVLPVLATGAVANNPTTGVTLRLCLARPSPRPQPGSASWCCFQPVSMAAAVQRLLRRRPTGHRRPTALGGLDPPARNRLLAGSGRDVGLHLRHLGPLDRRSGDRDRCRATRWRVGARVRECMGERNGVQSWLGLPPRSLPLSVRCVHFGVVHHALGAPGSPGSGR
ncbi:MAG: sensor histidine kinase [Egibacteraceae bacterium]